MSEQLTATIEQDIPPHLAYEMGKSAVHETVANPDSGFDISRANYEGNWSELALLRMASPDFREKFIHYINASADALPGPDPEGLVTLGKGADVDANKYRSDRIGDFEVNHATVSSHVNYVPADTYSNRIPGEHGYSPAYGEPIAVFSDDDTLTARMKDIIAAHEMHHSLVDSQGPAPRSLVIPAFDTSKIIEWNNNQRASGSDKRTPSGYITDPKELMARMAQLKNYYGMSGGEQFTQEHLEHAKKHYVADTGLDNNMTLFFSMIRDEKFIDAINRLPI